jgi:hypothetical protein
MGDGDMFHDNWKYSQLRQAELQKNAEAARLANLVMTKRPNRLYHLILVKLGGMLVAFGRLLHQRYAPTPRRSYAPPSAVVAPQSPSVAGWYINEKDCQQEVTNQARSQARFFKVNTSRGHKSTRKKTNQ